MKENRPFLKKFKFVAAVDLNRSNYRFYSITLGCTYFWVNIYKISTIQKLEHISPNIIFETLHTITESDYTSGLSGVGGGKRKKEGGRIYKRGAMLLGNS